MQLDEFIRKRHARELGKLDVIKLKDSTQKEIDEEYAKWPLDQAAIDHLEIIFDLANSYLGSLSDEEDESDRFQEEKERGYHQAYEEYDCIVLPKREPMRTRNKEAGERYLSRPSGGLQRHNRKFFRFIESKPYYDVDKLYSIFCKKIERLKPDQRDSFTTLWNKKVKATYKYSHGEFLYPEQCEIGYPIQWGMPSFCKLPQYRLRQSKEWIAYGYSLSGVKNSVERVPETYTFRFSPGFIEYNRRTVKIGDKSFFYRFKSYQRRIGENEYETVWNGHWEVHYKNVGWATIGWVDLPYSMPYSGRTASKKEIKKYKLKALGETLKPMPGTYDKG